MNWLGLQAGFNYVLSTTKTPASDYTQAVLNSQNNYWTVNFNSDFVLDDKTDLNVGYFYYRAADGQNNIVGGVPLGTDAEEHSVTAALTRRITQNLRLNLKYAFTHYDDLASAGHFRLRRPRHFCQPPIPFLTGTAAMPQPHGSEQFCFRSSRREEAHLKLQTCRDEPPHVGCYSFEKKNKLESSSICHLIYLL